ncbi:MAG: hypothetical protein GDA36_01550 [Rhodobacteraceae bacterium]|nr:hypothetical protein [Paracoccaceae bacterium]
MPSILKEKGICRHGQIYSKFTVVPFDLPSEFSPDPLTKVIRASARELLGTAVQAEVSACTAGHVHLLDEENRQEENRQRLVRHGFLPGCDLCVIVAAMKTLLPSYLQKAKLLGPDGPVILRRSRG